MLRKKAFAEPPRPSRPLVIVAADDVPEIQHLLVTWLSAAGHTVTALSSGRELLRAVREQACDLVITDIVMPDGDGHDVIAAVTRLCPGTRILATSGGGTKMPADTGLRIAKGLGADVLLPKPFTQAQLLRAVDQVMRR
jgi:two-component system nitrogen regulation response regulator GlnG